MSKIAFYDLFLRVTGFFDHHLCQGTKLPKAIRMCPCTIKYHLQESSVLTENSVYPFCWALRDNKGTSVNIRLTSPSNRKVNLAEIEEPGKQSVFLNSGSKIRHLSFSIV